MSRMREFGLQWHITTKCDKLCSHCYMKNSPYFRREQENELDFESLKKIVLDLVEFCDLTRTRPHISFTGGDPLLREDFFELLGFIKKLEIQRNLKFSLRILGNPGLLTPSLIRDLENFGVERYQLSLDGLADKHDQARRLGSFKETLEAFDLLRNSKIRSLCMFSLSKSNALDLKEVMRLVVSRGVDVFAFARVVPFGVTAKQDIFSPFEYRDFLSDIYKCQSEIMNGPRRTKFSFKDHLWKLFFYEKGDMVLSEIHPGQIVGGCGMGINTLSVLADGTVYACRRFISPVGKVPFSRIQSIFLGNKLNAYRNIEKLEKCSSCILKNHCRGCPAVAWGNSGSYTSADPQCWKS